MAFINTGIEEKGIRELLAYKPSSGSALLNLAQALLHGPSPIAKKDREIIAAYTSKLNQCEFCYESHRAAAVAHYNDEHLVTCILEQPHLESIDPKLRHLLTIVEKVQKSGSLIHQEDIDLAKSTGITDEEIHDAVLITAAFCMYNRYVDGLGAVKLANRSDYMPMGQRMAEMGYGSGGTNQ
jgi:uncharacterized peroxidase-related enzyme